MTEQIPGLMGFVARTLKAEPGISSTELYERSQGRYPDVTEMTVRQFHARYPLQVKRQLKDPTIRRPPNAGKSALEAAAPPRPEARKAAPEAETASAEAATAGRAAETASADEGAPRQDRADRGARKDRARTSRRELRMLFFRLAMDLETAPERADLVDVISRIDGYADEALKIARSANG